MKKIGTLIWEMIEKTVSATIRIVLRALSKEENEEIYLSIIQFVKFGIVGLSNTVISYVLYVLSLVLFQNMDLFVNIDYFIAQVISFILSVLWSFYWNNKFVFSIEEGEHRSVWKALIKTYISYSFTGLFLNSLLLGLWVQVFHISEFIAPIINLLVSVPLNFIINKLWAFKSEE